LLRRQGKHGVAVREQHLTVRHPGCVVAERFKVAEKTDLIDVGHDADAEFHAVQSCHSEWKNHGAHSAGIILLQLE